MEEKIEIKIKRIEKIENERKIEEEQKKNSRKEE